jgi:hypothetical protein
MKNFLIDVEFGGLGDHLFYSPIPRLLKEKHGNGARVYLSSSSKFRNWQIYGLIWANNPYLDGIRNKSELSFEEQLEIQIVPNAHVSQHILARYSLDFSHEVDPEIHFDLPSISSPHDYLIDLNYSSYTGLLESDILRILEKISTKYIFINPEPKIKKLITEYEHLQTTSLFEYASLIQKSKRFICLTSGGATLARALGVSAYVYTEPQYPQMFKHKENRHILIGEKNIYRRLVRYYLWEKNIKRRLNDP